MEETIMTLDSTAKEAYVKDSLKKFFVDSFFTTEGIKLTFDKGLAVPKVQGIEIDRWISITFGSVAMSFMSSFDLDIYICTKRDDEGKRLSILRDIVVGYLTDTAQTDGMKRITLYSSHPSSAWTDIGSFLVTDIIESSYFTTEDETKYKIVTARLKWATKI